MSYDAMQEHAFNLAWKLSGRKTLQIVGAVSKWHLPDGVAYNDRLDGFYNGSTRVDMDWEVWGELTTARYIAGDYTKSMQETMPGIVEVNRGVVVTVLGGPAVQAALDHVWGVELGGALYRVQAIQPFPLGADVPTFYNLTLTEDV